MIPNLIHFVWIGNSLPLYADNVISAYKHFNPNFQVILHHLDDMYSYDEDAEYVRNHIFSPSNNFYKSLWRFKYPSKLNINTTIGANIRFSDCYRFRLLEKYGGIYVDFDTFPIMSFEPLCQFDSIGVNVGYYDIFFMGFKKQEVFKHISIIDDTAIQFCNIQKTIDYKAYHILNKQYAKRNNQFIYDFMQGKLSIGSRLITDNLINDYYIDHIRTHEWET